MPLPGVLREATEKRKIKTVVLCYNEVPKIRSVLGFGKLAGSMEQVLARCGSNLASREPLSVLFIVFVVHLFLKLLSHSSIQHYYLILQTLGMILFPNFYHGRIIDEIIMNQEV